MLSFIIYFILDIFDLVQFDTHFFLTCSQNAMPQLTNQHIFPQPLFYFQISNFFLEFVVHISAIIFEHILLSASHQFCSMMENKNYYKQYGRALLNFQIIWSLKQTLEVLYILDLHIPEKI